MPRDRTVGRRIARWCLGGAFLLFLVGFVGVVRLQRDLEPEIRARRGHFASAEVSLELWAGGYVEQLARVHSTSGLVVDLAVRRPLDPAGTSDPARRPLAVLIGGYETGRDAIHLVSDSRGVAVAALSYPYEGPKKPKGLSFLLAVPSMQQGIRDTPAAILLALDWLAEQPWVDPARIELVGVSLGAPFACVAGALDPRLRRVWSLHGAGSPRVLFEHSLRKRISFGPGRAAAAWLVSLLAYGDGIAPERWVSRIAPRPFVMVNASDDERLPRDAILLLYEAAEDPKEILWMEGRHVEPERAAVVGRLIDTVLSRMVEKWSQ